MEVTLEEIFNQQSCMVHSQVGSCNPSMLVVGESVNGILKKELGVPWSTTPQSEDERRSWCSRRFATVEYMRSKGFTQFPKVFYIKGNPCHKIFSDLHYAIEYIMPTLPSLAISVGEALQLLGKFHSCSDVDMLESDLLCNNFSPCSLMEQSDEYSKYKEFAKYFQSDEFKNIYRSLPQQIIHGDFTRQNLVRNETQKIFVVDLDKMKLDARLWDFTTMFGWEYLDKYILHIKNETLKDLVETHYGELTDLEWKYFHTIVMFNRIGFLSYALSRLAAATTESGKAEWNTIVTNTRRDIDKILDVVEIEH